MAAVTLSQYNFTWKSKDWAGSLLVHLALLLALFISVQWKTKPEDTPPVQIELFTPPVPQRVETPVENKVEARVENKVENKPEPAPDIALEKRKAEKMAEKKAEEKKADEKRTLEKKAEEKKAAEKLASEKVAAEKTKTEKLEKAERAATAAANAEKESNEKQREEALRKIIAGASTTGVSSNSGAGNEMTASDLARIRSMIRDNTVFQIPESMTGNPKAEFVVALTPECSVQNVKLKKSSGLASWDDAAERALSRVRQFPKPMSGKCASSYEISHQPK